MNWNDAAAHPMTELILCISNKCGVREQPRLTHPNPCTISSRPSRESDPVRLSTAAGIHMAPCTRDANAG